MENIIELKNVSYYYDDNVTDVALEDISLSIKRGSFTVILGHNGSGKSTLAKLLNALIKPTSGEVLVNGLNTSDEENNISIKRSVGMVFQNPDNQLIASIVEDDTAFGPENLGLEPKVIRERVDEALKTVGMYDFRLGTPHRLSGGQKQRIAIAGIIAMEPECLVLDEPTAMLDPKGREEIITCLERLNKEKGITVVLITHFMEEARFADRVIVMNDGKIVDDDTPNKVFQNIDYLKSIGLAVPKTTELLNLLKNNGISVNTGAISIEDTVTEIINALSSEE